MFTLETAIQFALDAHAGQTDKVGEPYILHPLRVLFAFPPYQVHQRMVAVMHDVLEDTKATAEDMINLGAPAEVVAACVLMNHGEGIPYPDYIKGLLSNDLARSVKKADIKDNMSMERMIRLDKGTTERLTKKYTQALALINQYETSV